VREELDAAALDRIVASTPLGRDTTTGEVAEWVALLAAGGADSLSGSMLELDGGASLRGAAGQLAGPAGPAG
jgi:NAD(P)-dependent dehydrogenase (short-subunit alcohol dehydrogenase family)